MAARKRKAAGTVRKKQKRLNFQLGFTGLAGITVVSFCLFLWMFLLGIWAGQTILLPSVNDSSLQLSQGGDHFRNKDKNISTSHQNNLPVIHPDGRKKVIDR